MRMLHERLFGTAPPLDGVDDVETCKVFDAQHHIHVVEPEVQIADDDATAVLCELYPEVGGDGRLADSPLPRCDHDLSCHC